MKMMIALLAGSMMFTSYTSCNAQNKSELPKGTSKTTAVSEKFVIDKKESIVTWKCSMVIAIKGGHTGFISASKGELLIEKNQLVGGTVDIDMSTITDEHHNSDNGLIDHLKSPDFFDVEKFPISTFVVTKVAPADGGNVTVTGNLTVKGITHEISFPATVEVKDDIVKANGKVTIDRTKWDVRYKSAAFFSSLADEAISDSIEFEMNVVAKK
jgi:polyisoprenoid-binding protein YceI